MGALRVAAIASVIVMTACQPRISADSYAIGSVGQVNRTVRGVVISARAVNVSGTQSGLGAGAGALTGGIAGSAIGSGARANAVGAVAGALVGGIAGAVIEESASRQIGMEYVVQTDNGALLTIVQGSELPLSVGQKVLAIYGTQSRVIADPAL